MRQQSKEVINLSSTHLQLQNRRSFLLIFSLFLVLLAPAANAITKHLSMIDKNGNPLPTTIITITAPDGKSTKRVTDVKGILEYDFKQGGVYTLSDPAGNTIKTISIAGSGMSKPVMLGVAAGGAGVLLLAAGSSGSDSVNDPGTGGPGAGDPGTGDPGTGDPGTGDPGGGETGSLAGTYNVTTTVANNPGDLPVLLSTLVLKLEIIGTALTIIQTSNNVNFPARLSGTIVDEAFTANATGSYDGSSTLFLLAGSVSIAQGLSFLINIGSDGSLQGGQALTYNATGTK